MKINIVSKRVELTNSIREKIENTFYNLERYLSDDTDVHVKLDVTKRSQKIEVTIFTKNGTIIRAEDSKDDLYNAIDVVYNKLYKQIRRLKTQLINKNKSNESIRFNNIDKYDDINIESDSIIKRVKKFNLDKPLTTEDAIMQMDLLGHNFFVFRNLDSEDLNIVYKRHDGYGLIEQI
ncbi:ribosome hibernation-promoting factor, HPF/YfiA family [Romboutsia sp. 1001713B170207_170306_H8]|uniref:ribosome hibernation-promoting factor, HPF/YfiA family n=1 Tax=Romboutsia sp. 1001713B170207_170306_H8 TaxID=2787112 RepID=UPI0008231C0A|nr:ribosome-associated translation inhibitor RaiA [Romboutsia sp. 1001713B170207_170306_H8]SCH00393.1 SigL modulation protein [uncultured Clostridium sp.]